MLCKEKCSSLKNLWRTSFLQSIVCWECSTGMQLNRLLYIQIYDMSLLGNASKWKKKPALPDIVCNFAFCSMCCIFFGQLLRCAAQTHSTLLCTSTIFHTCLKTPGGFLSFQIERGLVYELRLCFKDGPFFQKECGIVPQSSSVPLGFKTIYFHFSWCLPDKKKDNYCLWKVHDLNLSFEILHVMLHTYSVATNASKRRYISCFLFWGGISSWNLQHVEPIVLKECILQLNMCFSLGQASSF